MVGLANVYICGKCGDVTDVYLFEHIDCESDDVYPIMHCGKCHREVTEKKIDGLSVYTEVEESYSDVYSY